MTSPTSLYLLRHAEVEPRYQRVFGGRIDMDLSERGHEQASALANYLGNRRFDAFYASPMKRVQQTLKPFQASPTNPGATTTAPHPAPVILPGLREVDFGDWTGLGWEDVRTRFQVSAFQWLHLLEQAAIPNSECAGTFRSRVEPCVRQILADHPGQSVAVACHGGTIRMILSILLDVPFSKTAAFEIDYASLTVVQHTAHKTEIQLLNFTPWRDLQ